MIVYIYERLSQNVHHFVRPRAGHVDQPDATTPATATSC